jgi:catechol 2,3-dioxygenase
MTDSMLPAGTRLGRVALGAGDLDRLVEFYESVVGLAVQHREADCATLGAGGSPLLELQADPDAPPRQPTAAGLFHTAFRVPDRAALGAALARIEADWQLTGASDHRVSEALYLRDPEDNGVEIYCERPRSAWPTSDGRVAMDTLSLDLDPLRAAAGATSEATAGVGTDSLPHGTDVGHVHLEVTDLSAVRAFYVDALGFGVRQRMDGALFVAAGEYHHHLGFNVWNGSSSPAAGRGLDWVELAVPGDALDSARQRLADHGAGVCETDDGIAVTDPHGIVVMLSATSP